MQFILAHFFVALSLLLHTVSSAPTGAVTFNNGLVNVLNPTGTAKGVPVANNKVVRFVVKYADAARWANPIKATTWQMRDNNPTTMPLSCPQPYGDPSTYSEDCLYVVLYVPMTALTTLASLPIYVWHHGGSFVFGSSNNPGLDGSNLALATNSIVAVVQYRLGVFGFLPPSSGPAPDGNFAVKDAIANLQFLRTVLPSFGGNINRITVGGQSSGGHMVRALLASPSASSLFMGGTIHSDPINYGFMKNSVYQKLQSNYFSSKYGSCSNDFNCLLWQSTASLANTGFDFGFYGEALALDPSVGAAEPFRPHFDGTLITATLTTSYPSGAKKPLLLSSSKNDGGPSVSQIPFGVVNTPALPYASAVSSIVSVPAFASTIIASDFYNPNSPTLVQPYVADGDEGRQALERMITDGVFRCAAWDFGRRWTAQGGKVWIGEFNLGSTYPSNAGYSYCTSSGRVCHEDEIFIIFGTAPSPTSAQSVLIQYYQARLKQFLTNPSGGPGGSPATMVSGTNANAVQMGGSQSGQAVPVNACAPSFWGASVSFDWQSFGE